MTTSELGTAVVSILTLNRHAGEPTQLYCVHPFTSAWGRLLSLSSHSWIIKSPSCLKHSLQPGNIMPGSRLEVKNLDFPDAHIFLPQRPWVCCVLPTTEVGRHSSSLLSLIFPTEAVITESCTSLACHRHQGAQWLPKSCLSLCLPRARYPTLWILLPSSSCPL